MRTYEEVCKQVTDSIKTNGFSFPQHEVLDYTGVGFGYNLQASYPKTNKQAIKDAATPLFDKLLKGVK